MDDRLTREARARLTDVRSLFAHHVPYTREMLRKVLAAPDPQTPVVGSGRRGFGFEGQLAFDQVLSGVGISDSRDGQYLLAHSMGPRDMGHPASAP